MIGNYMKKFASVLLLFLFLANAIFPCGPGYVTPLFDRRYEPENPYEIFASGKLGILKPSFRRVVLFAAYRYLNNGNFTASTTSTAGSTAAASPTTTQDSMRGSLRACSPVRRMSATTRGRRTNGIDGEAMAYINRRNQPQFRARLFAHGR